MTSCPTPLPLAELVAYTVRELDHEAEERLEQHYFECATCSARLESVMALGQGLREVVRAGEFFGVARHDLLSTLTERGIKVRAYRLEPGVSVQCTAAPDDDFVAVILSDIGQRSVDLSVTTRLVKSGDESTIIRRALDVDAAHGELVLLFPGSAVRAYPRSTWTMYVGEMGKTPSYVMNHTPWQELPDSDG